ncbi:MAG TPA: HlyD family secretion protein [Rhizomicrobium sp.]|nr:HlyD family secretion protein [Rhizomicrobium sp.]
MTEGWPKLSWHRGLEIAWRLTAFLVAVAIIVAVTTQWNSWEGSPGWQSTDDAYLEADVTPIAAKVPGYLRRVPAQDFERVHAGELLALVVDDDYRAAVAQAQAAVASARAQYQTVEAQLALQQANVQAADAVVISTMAALDQNTRDVARQKKLFATGSSSTEEGEKLDTTRAQLEAQLRQNQAQAAAARRQLGVLDAQAAQARATIAAQIANLGVALINLGYTRIVAPQAGELGQRQVRIGQYVGVGTQITTLTPLPHVWVIANYKETQLTHMAVGEAARIRVDTFPGHVLKGHVTGFSPGSGDVFALLPPDNATGNFTKVVQRIPVKIAIDDAAGLADLLRPGMSVVVEVNARNRLP